LKGKYPMTKIKIVVSEPTHPEAKEITQADVWGAHDENFNRLSLGMLVARGYPQPDGEYTTQEEYDKATAELPAICPIWFDHLPYKSVTVICPTEQEDEVSYWLEFVHGANCIEKVRRLENGKSAIRSNYMCW
jgi:hypothetical protein